MAQHLQPSLSRPVLIRLFLTVWIVYLFFVGLDARPGRFAALTMSIVERGQLNVDPYAETLTDSFEREGHFYINSNPGTSFLAVPAWAVVYPIYSSLPETSALREPVVHAKLSEVVGYATTSALAVSLCAVLLAAFVFRRTRSTYRAGFTAVLFAFGTIAFRLSQGMNNNQNVIIAACCVAMFCLLFSPQMFPRFVYRHRWTMLGAVGGIGVVVDLSILPFLLVLAYPLIRRLSGWRQGGNVVLGAIPFLLLLWGYQFAVFGNPFVPPQAYVPSSIHTGPGSGLFGLSMPDFSMMLSHLVGLERGLFLFMPFAIAVVGYMGRESYRHLFIYRAALPSHLWMTAATLGVYLLFAGAVESSIFSVYGPRYLLPAIPFLCLCFGLYARHRHATALAGLVAASFWINGSGAAIGIGSPVVWWSPVIFMVRGPWFPILTWVRESLAPILELPSLMTPFGLLAILIVIGVVLWGPYVWFGEGASSSRATVNGTVQRRGVMETAK